jgi:hypothetical protein
MQIGSVESDLDLLLLGDSSSTIGWGRYAGIYRIASECRSAGFSVKVIDHFIEAFSTPSIKKTLLSFISTRSPRVIGLSSTFLKRYLNKRFSPPVYENEVFAEHNTELEVLPFGVPNEEMREFLNFLRAKKIVVVVGGSEDPSIFSEFQIDHFVVGQGEVSILEILKRTSRDKSVITQQEKIFHQDVFRFEKFNESKINWDSSDIIFDGEALPIEIARGCIFKCVFCNFQLNGKSKNEFVKLKEVITHELVVNFQKYGTTSYIVSDDLLNDSLEKISMLRDIALALPFKLSFTAYLRLDMLWRYPDMIPLLKEAGLKACYFGIETLNDASGRAVGKGLGEKRIKETLEQARKVWGNEVWISAGLIVGLPHETLESNARSISWMLEKDCPVDFFKISPLIVYNSAQATSQVFGVRADSLGYKVREGRFFSVWENEYMSYAQAVDFCSEFYSTVDPRKWQYAHFCTYSRLINLGYSDDQKILANLHVDLHSRKRAKVKTYLDKVLV